MRLGAYTMKVDKTVIGGGAYIMKVNLSVFGYWWIGWEVLDNGGSGGQRINGLTMGRVVI